MWHVGGICRQDRLTHVVRGSRCIGSGVSVSDPQAAHARQLFMEACTCSGSHVLHQEHRSLCQPSSQSPECPAICSHRALCQPSFPVCRHRMRRRRACCSSASIAYSSIRSSGGGRGGACGLWEWRTGRERGKRRGGGRQASVGA